MKFVGILDSVVAYLEEHLVDEDNNPIAKVMLARPHKRAELVPIVYVYPSSGFAGPRKVIGGTTALTLYMEIEQTCNTPDDEKDLWEFADDLMQVFEDDKYYFDYENETIMVKGLSPMYYSGDKDLRYVKIKTELVFIK